MAEWIRTPNSSSGVSVQQSVGSNPGLINSCVLFAFFQISFTSLGDEVVTVDLLPDGSQIAVTNQVIKDH